MIVACECLVVKFKVEKVLAGAMDAMDAASLRGPFTDAGFLRAVALGGFPGMAAAMHIFGSALGVFDKSGIPRAERDRRCNNFAALHDKMVSKYVHMPFDGMHTSTGLTMPGHILNMPLSLLTSIRANVDARRTWLAYYPDCSLCELSTGTYDSENSFSTINTKYGTRPRAALVLPGLVNTERLRVIRFMQDRGFWVYLSRRRQYDYVQDAEARQTHQDRWYTPRPANSKGDAREVARVKIATHKSRMPKAVAVRAMAKGKADRQETLMH